MDLTANEFKILHTMAHLVKDNLLNMDIKQIQKVAKEVGISESTVRNNLTSLVKKDIIVKAGSLPIYVLDPAIVVVGNEAKCLKNYENAFNSTSTSFKDAKEELDKKSRDPFDMNKFESELRNRRAQEDDSELLNEAKQRFGFDGE